MGQTTVDLLIADCLQLLLDRRWFQIEVAKARQRADSFSIPDRLPDYYITQRPSKIRDMPPIGETRRMK